MDSVHGHVHCQNYDNAVIRLMVGICRVYGNVRTGVLYSKFFSEIVAEYHA